MCRSLAPSTNSCEIVAMRAGRCLATHPNSGKPPEGYSARMVVCVYELRRPTRDGRPRGPHAAAETSRSARLVPPCYRQACPHLSLRGAVNSMPCINQRCTRPAERMARRWRVGRPATPGRAVVSLDVTVIWSNARGSKGQRQRPLVGCRPSTARAPRAQCPRCATLDAWHNVSSSRLLMQSATLGGNCS